MRILINGLPHFAKKLADDLNEFDAKNTYIFIDTYNSAKEKLKFLLLLPFSKKVISFNGVTDASGSLDWVLKFRKKLIMQWMGTDVLLAVERSKSSSIIKKYTDYAIHFADFDLLINELKSVNINASYLDFKYTFPKARLEKYERINVLTYVLQDKQAFYGMEKVCLLAKRFPELTFNVLGVTKSDYETTANINLLGWRDTSEVDQLTQESAIFLRFTEHDGCSLSVIQALGYGAEVLWTFPFPFVHEAKTKEEIFSQFEIILNKINTRNLIPNQEASDYIKAKYNRPGIIKNYLKTIHSL